MTYSIAITYVSASGHLRVFSAEITAPDDRTARDEAIRRFGLSHRRCAVRDTCTVEIED